MGETKVILTDVPTSHLLSPKKLSKSFRNSGALLVRMSSNARFWEKNETQRCPPMHKDCGQQKQILGSFLLVKRKLKSEKGDREIILSDKNLSVLSVGFGRVNVLTSKSGLIQQMAVISGK